MRTCIPPSRPVRRQALTVGLPPQERTTKGGLWESGPNAGCGAPLLSPRGPGPQAGTSFPLSDFFPPLPSLLSPSVSLLLPPEKKASGFWLLLPGNQTGCRRLRGAAQMLPNEGAEMRGRHLCLQS